MTTQYEPDNFTLNDVLLCLDRAGLKHKKGSRYVLTQCPLHEDKNASAQIYVDDFFVKCHAGCEGGRFHITKAFPELRSNAGQVRSYQSPTKKRAQDKMNYKKIDLMEMWKGMQEIPADHQFKTIDISILNDLGWRYDPATERYFIPYFSRSKTTIPFGQWRNLKTGPRFNFWKDAKPTMYGTWNLELGETLFLVEGCSDAAVLDYCAIPWIAAPSAASGELVKTMAGWCKENGVKLVYAGDNDAAGDKLKDALDQVMPYRVKQPRQPYKDWGDMLEAEGFESVQDYCMEELAPKEYEPTPENEKTPLEKVQDVFPGARELKMVDPAEKKEVESNVLF